METDSRSRVDGEETARRDAQRALNDLWCTACAGSRPGVAVSACLLGCACRFDASARTSDAVIALIECLRERGCRIRPVCPESSARLARPRPPAEQTEDGCVVDRAGNDVTAAFLAGAQATLRLVRSAGARVAVLKAKSPSCGRYSVYDGSFGGVLIPGSGIAARLLEDAGVAVVDEIDVATFWVEIESGRNGTGCAAFISTYKDITRS